MPPFGSVFPGSSEGPADSFGVAHEPSVAQIVQTLCVHACSCFDGFNCIVFVELKDSSPDKTTKRDDCFKLLHSDFSCKGSFGDIVSRV